MIGCAPDRGTSFPAPRRRRPAIVTGASSSPSDPGIDGPCGEEVRERCCRAGVDLDAALRSWAARSPWCSCAVMRERLEDRFGRESTRGNESCLSSRLDFPLSSIESSHSSESSSIALSSISSSSSVSEKTSLFIIACAAPCAAISSLNEVVFFCGGTLVNELRACFMLLLNELSSPDEPPSMKPPFFWFIFDCCMRDSIELS